jgi:hypothetical protein
MGKRLKAGPAQEMVSAVDEPRERCVCDLFKDAKPVKRVALAAITRDEAWNKRSRSATCLQTIMCRWW